MFVFNHDDDGYFTDVTKAHANPEEEGQYLLPARASFVSPPTHDRATHRAKYMGNDIWRIEKRELVTVNGQQLELRSEHDLRAIAQIMLNETTDEVLECYEECISVPEYLVTYRRALRAVIRGTSVQLPRLLRVPKWPAFKGNK